MKNLFLFIAEIILIGVIILYLFGPDDSPAEAATIHLSGDLHTEMAAYFEPQLGPNRILSRPTNADVSVHMVSDWTRLGLRENGLEVCGDHCVPSNGTELVRVLTTDIRGRRKQVFLNIGGFEPDGAVQDWTPIPCAAEVIENEMAVFRPTNPALCTGWSEGAMRTRYTLPFNLGYLP